MLPAAIRANLVLAMLTLFASCKRVTAPTTSPASAAYTDGFEAVVFEVRDGVPTKVRSLPLKDAEQAIASGSQALIPGDPAVVQRQISTGRSGDSKVVFFVQSVAEAKQQVRVSFHEGDRTFVYEYVVDGNQLRPVTSEYHDLGKSKVVRYAGNNITTH
jgi:hypothetical protein